MKCFYSWFAGIFSAVLLMASNAMALDVSTLTATFDGAKSDLEAFVVVILGVLATMWVARKFIKTTNRS